MLEVRKRVFANRRRVSSLSYQSVSYNRRCVLACSSRCIFAASRREFAARRRVFAVRRRVFAARGSEQAFLSISFLQSVGVCS